MDKLSAKVNVFFRKLFGLGDMKNAAGELRLANENMREAKRTLELTLDLMIKQREQ